MAKFNLREWKDQEHNFRKSVKETMEKISNWTDPAYPIEVTNFLIVAKRDKVLSKAVHSAARGQKSEFVIKQQQNFEMLKAQYNVLKKRLENLEDAGKGEWDNFEAFEEALLNYLNHWTARIHTCKANVGKNIVDPKGPSKSSIKRFRSERDEKKRQQRMFIDEAPKDPFSAFANEFASQAA